MWLNIRQRGSVVFEESMFFKRKTAFQKASFTVNKVHTHVWVLKKMLST